MALMCCKLAVQIQSQLVKVIFLRFYLSILAQQLQVEDTHTSGTMNITGEFANNGEAWKGTPSSGYVKGAFTKMATRDVTNNSNSSNNGCYYSFDASKT